MDAIGRKWLVIGGLFLTGTSLILMPLFNLKVFPYLYILRIVEEIGMVPSTNSPLYIDYVQLKSIPVSSAWMSILATASGILSFGGINFL